MLRPHQKLLPNYTIFVVVWKATELQTTAFFTEGWVLRQLLIPLPTLTSCFTLTKPLCVKHLAQVVGCKRIHSQYSFIRETSLTAGNESCQQLPVSRDITASIIVNLAVLNEHIHRGCEERREQWLKQSGLNLYSLPNLMLQTGQYMQKTLKTFSFLQKFMKC